MREENNCDPDDCKLRMKWLTNGPPPGSTFMLGFGEDARGELWALTNEIGIPFRETGVVMKLVRECADEPLQNGTRDNSGNQCRD